MSDRNYDFCDDPLNELVASDARVKELEDELAEAQSKILCWISVEERLPEDGQNVIACFEGGGIDRDVGEATFDKVGGWFSTEHGAWAASHWMKLPEPPDYDPVLADEDRESIQRAVRQTIEKMNFLGGAKPEVQ